MALVNERGVGVALRLTRATRALVIGRNRCLWCPSGKRRRVGIFLVCALIDGWNLCSNVLIENVPLLRYDVVGINRKG